ncbi:MAG: molybdate ABC transporter permease subunit [Deltaproteobacteria bacterium]|nr:molybdate ABC transporter permease subunit [Deltaproteobacteria bacterium]
MIDALASSLLLSLKIALVAMTLICAIATPLAWVLARTNFRGKFLIESILLLPLTLPPVSIGLVLLYLMAPRGVLGTVWASLTGHQLLLTWQAAAVAAGVIAFPLYLRSAMAAFASVPRRLEMMAETLGLDPWVCWWRVTLPLAARGLAAGALISLARALGEFGATTMVGGAIPGETQTLAVGIYNNVMNGEEATAAAFAGVSFMIALMATIVSRWLGRDTVTEVSDTKVRLHEV